MSPTPSSCIVACAGTRKRTCQTTSLASRRRACSASFSPAAVAFFESSPFVALNVSSSPCMPPTRSCSASTACSVAGRTGPGTSSPVALSTSCCCCWIRPPSCVSSSACLSPGVVRSSARSVPILAELEPIVPISRHRTRSSCSASCRSSSPGPRRRAARRSGSRTRRTRSDGGSASSRAARRTAAARGPPPPPARGARGRAPDGSAAAFRGSRRPRRSRSRECRRRASSRCCSRRGRAESTPCSGPEGTVPAAAKRR